MKMLIIAGSAVIGLGFLTHLFQRAGSGWIIAVTIVAAIVSIAISISAIRQKRWLAASTLGGWALLMIISLSVNGADPQDATIAVAVTAVIAGITLWRWSIA